MYSLLRLHNVGNFICKYCFIDTQVVFLSKMSRPINIRGLQYHICKASSRRQKHYAEFLTPTQSARGSLFGKWNAPLLFSSYYSQDVWNQDICIFTNRITCMFGMEYFLITLLHRRLLCKPRDGARIISYHHAEENTAAQSGRRNMALFSHFHKT